MSAEFNIPRKEGFAPHEQPARKHPEEWRELPADPDNITFRGRHEHVDRFTMNLIDAKTLPKGSPIRVLDFAASVLPFGAPTSHDLHDRISEAGLKPEITAVDINIPDNLNPSYPDINYARSLTGAEGNFQIARMLNLIQWVSEEDYAEIREQVTSRLEEGGLFITTEETSFCYRASMEYGETWTSPVQMVKVMQKKGRRA